ncbi:FxLYD domain-containing protein [Aneurinibacillus sp. Ricciae_BoGa-3]|uniref:FxLYD domain-containing protein n=1 Tax=Aneurinibacillus sp. Ricciae_BoGa-3 TaxID=3022697 RepID=UPI0023411961|nr:FxLYD domain-containing protein [Aneurinibacillus sp. Ricciae_BoGa-3]WCK56401.1 FxLYD domain-containing protein [Aneurinibacillus sp. Ricciae_BoGa-3]
MIHSQQEQIQNAEQSAPSEMRAPAVSKKIWLIPAASAVIVAAGLLADYGYQSYINNRVFKLRQNAESMALEGNIKTAKQLISQSLAMRPTLAVLKQDKQLLDDASAIESKVNSAQSLTANHKYPEAITAIEQAKDMLQTRSGPLYTMLLKKTQNQEEAATVSQIKSEMVNKNTMTDLAPLLTKLDAFKGIEATKAKDSITQKMSDVAYSTAAKALKDKDFDKADSTIKEALKYDEQNRKLVSFQQTISSQRKNFEQAEQRSMEQAAEAATLEDIKNRTQAVQVSKISYGVNNVGDFEIRGDVVNKATRPISSIIVTYQILDDQGNTVSQNSTYVYPYYLNVGETGNFDATEYFDPTMKTAKISRVAWSLN